MKKLVNYLLIVVATLLMSGCAAKSYVGKVDMVAIGAGAKAVSTSDKQYINENALPGIVVGYTPNLSITEQGTSDTVKYVAGEALIKTYSGEPKFLADYLNSYQKIENKVLILDKNGVVAWSGHFSGTDINSAKGIYDYGLTGKDYMPFNEAMEKFVIDEETTDYDEDKKIEFPKGNKESFMSGFSYSKKFPLLFTKLPNMTIESSKGSVDLSNTISNNKPTVLVFFMSQGDSGESLLKDVAKAKDLFNMVRGKASDKKAPTPNMVLKQLQDTYTK